MQRLVNFVGNAGVVALLAVPVLAMAGAVHAEDFHVRAGDLSRSDRVAIYRQDVETAADSLCTGYPNGPTRADQVKVCRQAVREEAEEKLSPRQREQLASTAPSYALASGR